MHANEALRPQEFQQLPLVGDALWENRIVMAEIYSGMGKWTPKQLLLGLYQGGAEYLNMSEPRVQKAYMNLPDATGPMKDAYKAAFIMSLVLEKLEFESILKLMVNLQEDPAQEPILLPNGIQFDTHGAYEMLFGYIHFTASRRMGNFAFTIIDHDGKSFSKYFKNEEDGGQSYEVPTISTDCCIS